MTGSTSSAAQRPAPSVILTDLHDHRRTLGELGLPNGVSLEGTNVERSIAFRLPANAHIDNAHLFLQLQFSRSAIPESNLQVFANDVRAGVALRSQADSTGRTAVDLVVPQSVLTGDFLNVSFRSSVAAVKDRCLDQRLSLTYVNVDPGSYFTYANRVREITTIRQAWSTLPDTIAIAFPARRLLPEEFRAAFTAGIAASNEGRIVRYARFPALGDVTIAKVAEVTALPQVISPPPAARNLSVFHYTDAGGERVSILVDAEHGATGAAFLAPRWTTLTGQPALDVRDAEVLNDPTKDPTFADLGITDLTKAVGGEAVWRISLDLRDFPVGRVPSSVELRVVTAPNTGDRQLVVFAFLNGTLVRSMNVNESGTSQFTQIRLPSSLLTTRNELRVVMQRHLAPSDACTQLDLPIPAQILPSSRVVTTEADHKARVFTAVTARLGPESPLYLPVAALDHPEVYLPLIIPLGRAFWSAIRAPTPQFYAASAPPAPTRTFIVLGAPPATKLDGSVASGSGHLKIHKKNSTETLLDISDLSGWSIAQVVQWGDQIGLQVMPSSVKSRLPDWPDAYANSTLVLADPDSSIFQLNTVGRDASLLFNDGPTLVERIRGDWILWGIFLVLIGGPPIVLGLRAIVRRTPRRRMPRRFDRNVPPTS